MAEGLSSVFRLLPVMHDAGLTTSTTLFLGTRQGISSESGRDQSEASAYDSWGARQALYERLGNFDFTEDELKDKSLFQLVTLEILLVGHRNYIGTYTCTCRTLEELFGDQFWHREENPENKVRDGNEPKPTLVN